MLMSGCVCTSGKVFQAMEPVLLQHCSITDGPLAWRGVLAGAAVFAEAALDTAPQNSPSSHMHTSRSAGTEACKGPSSATNSPASPACTPTMTLSFLAALPCVAAYYSCHADPAASPHVSQQSGELLMGLGTQLEPIIKLLKADAGLMLPFICALVSQGQQSVGQSSMSGGSHDQPSRQRLVEKQKGVVPVTAEHARQADAGLAESLADPAARGGGEQVVAAVEVLLALCKEQVLLAQLLELLQPLSEACSTLRYAVSAITLADWPKTSCCCIVRNAVHV